MAATDVLVNEGRAPWTVFAYVPVVILWTIAFRVAGDQGFPLVPTIVALVIDGSIGYGMYRRRKVAWTIALILMALPVLGLPGGVRARWVRQRPAAACRRGRTALSLASPRHPLLVL